MDIHDMLATNALLGETCQPRGRDKHRQDALLDWQSNDSKESKGILGR